MFSFLLEPARNHGVGVCFTDRRDGFSEGSLGSLNLGRSDVDEPAHLRANAAAVRERLGLADWVALHQVHGREVLEVDETLLAGWGPDSWLGTDGGQAPLPVADAAVTCLAGIGLLVRVADCVPVLLADPERGVLGAAHAGRAGFDAGVLAATVGRMREQGAQRLVAWIGPHVCGECYEVPEQMAEELSARHPGVASRTSWGTPSLDLGAGCQRQLEGLGVEVHRVDPCTRTDDQLHSHRRDGAGAGRLGAIIWRVSGAGGAPKASAVG